MADASANPTFYADLHQPQSLNKYQYSYNNPLRYVDSDGHDPVEPEPQDPKPVVPVPLPGPLPAPVPIPLVPTKGLTDQQILELPQKIWELPDPYLYPISQTIGTAPDPTINPVPVTPLLPVPLRTTGTPLTQNRQPLPPPPPIQVRGENKLNDFKRVGASLEVGGGGSQ